MHRTLLLALSAGLLLPACSREQAGQRADASRQPAAGGPGGSGFPAAAAKVTDACTLMPAERSKTLVPGGTAPQSERFPPRCTLGNGTAALQITLDNGPGDPINGAEAIPGLADGGYLERLDPRSRGDVYLTVILGKDANGFNWNVHVEMAGHDGNDHKADAIAVARDILLLLH